MAEFALDENIPDNKLVSDTVVSNNAHRRFATVADFCKELGGSKARVIEKVLIANNGVAAVKAIRSIRRWAYEAFGNEKAILFVVMATPEDLRANAEYIRMGDIIVDVPGGSNNHNYANVMLIVELARLHGVHAVWAGWGHASENPVLPDTLEKSDPPIKFIGPSGPPMRALGDKIGSTIIAQSAGVPCIAWNGQDVRASYDKESGTLPEEAYDQASVANASEAMKVADIIGFPIMIKASEGGGGKGIRRVDKAEDVANAYRQVCGEVPGSPIFIMKMSSNSRHLEVQLLADEYGDAIALNGRDCSVQRRHQKIIEEGPPVAAKPEVWKKMEEAAVALAKAVSYTNAGTVEYLYSEKESKFYFLELNPRLQVEHPVTEMITGVNLPAAQLQVAMGIPLQNIPGVRELYGRNRFEDEPSSPTSTIDFSVAERVPPTAHCIAVRITAENAEAGFKPTSGGIQELNFRSTPNVWGYFSMDSSGSIHEFADSQFGHLFASGPNREDARRNMVLALKELSIRGDISTTVDYISKLIELEDFVSNKIDTGWLDRIIKANVDGFALRSQSRSDKSQTLHNHAYAVIGAAITAYELCADGESNFVDLLEKGQLPGRSLLKVQHEFELILDGVKYELVTARKGPNAFAIGIQGSMDESVRTNIRVLSDGGYLIAIGGNSHVAYLTNKGDAATGMRISVAGRSILFSPDYDPTSLRTDVAGKLVKKLKPDGAHLKKGEPYCEIEVMKMFMPLKVEESGVLSWCVNEGASLSVGDLLAKLELDNPENVSLTEVFRGQLTVPGSSTPSSALSKERPNLVLKDSLEMIGSAMSGYVLSNCEVEKAFNDIAISVTSPMLPVLEVQEQLSVLSGRIPSTLFRSISGLMSDFKQKCASQAGSGAEMRFPADQILSLVDQCGGALQNPAEKTSFEGLTKALRDSVVPYSKSGVAGVPGSERAVIGFLDILRKWINVERWFCDKQSHADAVDFLRKSHKRDFRTVLDICRSHERLQASCEIVTRLLSIIGDGFLVDFRSGEVSAIGKRVSMVAGAESLPLAMPAVAEIGSMGTSSAYSEVALRARKLLLQESMPSLEQRRQKVLAAAADLSQGAVKSGLDAPRNVQELLSDHIPMADVLFPLLKTKADSNESVGLLELYVRHVYRPFSLKEFERDFDNKLVRFSFFNKPSEGALHAGMSVTSMTDLSRAASSGSLNGMISEKYGETVDEPASSASEKIPLTTQRTGIFAILKNLSDLEDGDKIRSILSSIPQFNGQAPKCDGGAINVLYFIVMTGAEMTENDVLATHCQALVEQMKSMLEAADVRRVSFIFDPESTDDIDDQIPSLFTFRYPTFKEDSLYRRIDPSLAAHLELNRVAANFNIRSLGSRHTPTCNAHLYEAVPRSSALAKDIKANKAPRVFVRALSFSLEFSSSGYERILVDALNALDLCSLKNTTDNHLFINLVSDFENSVLDPVVVEQIIVTVLKRHGDRVLNLGIAEVETRIVCCLSPNTPPIAIRLFASNPTGYVLVMNTYVEASGESGPERVFKLIGGTKASLASTGDSSWDGLRVRTPYPLTRPFDAQRKAALCSSDSVYCYDLPALFEAAVEQQWHDEAAKVDTSGIRNASRPLMVMYTTELVVRKRKSSVSQSWTMQDYLDGNLELIQEPRGAGANDVGMVAWLVELKTVEYPNGRQVVLIANDITHKAGSFGTREDVVFKLASEFARERRIPRLFIAANSGARIGLADKVRKKFKVAFKDPAKPEIGFDFLYVEKEDYEKFTSTDKPELKAVPASYEGRSVFKITDVIGSEPDLGVENLKGSGLIAGETSRANEDIFTLTIVLGRTVGIGAYLVRLGQRTIQKSSASPIILTGYQALNKLMGVEVYSTNDQLGGPGIMYSNGVSHVVEADHLRAIKAAVDWLSYVPSQRRGLLPITDIRGLDSVERQIAFTPKQGVPYDPRSLLAGCEDDSGAWLGGFFDRGSFTEALAGWAKTVVIGRARLGGIPMGVVITENRTTEAVKPADPADVKAAESIVQEAGCVWFPNSAYKTAQAIRDFRTEDLPLIVFANWRGFSGGQRDMFDEVLKYGSLIVDAFCSYEQPVFVFIPPFAEIRGGAWVVLDASINSAVMEMYASSGSARGGVLEANGAASVKYRTKDLIATMHRLDEKLVTLDKKVAVSDSSDKDSIMHEISARENALLPVYEQIAVQFCELHDTPGRMKSVGVIRAEVDWPSARSFFYWRLRRQLAIFDLRRQLREAASVGRGVRSLTPEAAGNLIREWFMETRTKSEWEDDKVVLEWMAREYSSLEDKIRKYASGIVAQEIVQVMTAGGQTANVGIDGILSGLAQALDQMSQVDREKVVSRLASVIQH